MLSSRQKKILNILLEKCSSDNAFFPTKDLADDCQVTLRTIQNDIKAIRTDNDLKSLNIDIYITPGKGYHLACADLNKLKKKLNENQDKEEHQFDSKQERYKYIIGTLLFSHYPILSETISNNMYISRSQFSSDLKAVKELLEPFELTIISNGHKGLTINGLENNKRFCLIDLGITIHHFAKGFSNGIDRNQLSDIVFSILTAHQYAISDLDIQNLLIYIRTAIYRISCSFLIDSYSDDSDTDLIERRISAHIFESLKPIYHCEYSYHEVQYLSSILKGHRIAIGKRAISKESEKIVVKAFTTIKAHYNLDFFNDFDLRTNLAMHLSELQRRYVTSTRSKNLVVNSIKQDFPLAYDIAVLTSGIIEEESDIQMSEDETGYIAVYFAMALEQLKFYNSSIKVLVISSSRRSESILLKHNLLSMFKDEIGDLDIIQANDVKKEDLARYSVVFTTTSSIADKEIMDKAIKINYFLTAEDQLLIENELSKISQKKTIADYLDPRLFFNDLQFNAPNELLKYLCTKTQELYPCDDDLYKLVMRREKFGSTTFANMTALPHPEYFISPVSVIAVAILEKPIQWNDDLIQIVFLINIEKGKEQELTELYATFSKLILNKSALNNIKANPTYENLLQTMATCYASIKN